MKFSIALSLSILTTATGQESPGDSHNLRTASSSSSSSSSNENIESSSAMGIERRLAPGNWEGNGPCDGICNAFTKANCEFPVPEICSLAKKVKPTGSEISKGCERLCDALSDFVCSDCGPPGPEPTSHPTDSPTGSPSKNPSSSPTQNPTISPTQSCHDLTSINQDVSIWSSNDPVANLNPPSLVTEEEPNEIASIQGSGQLNGGFTVLNKDGVELAIRIQKRFVGPISTPEESPIVGPYETGSKAGVYKVKSGFSDPTLSPTSPPGAWWNIDWHVDLRNAIGKTEISDYPGGLKMTAHCTANCHGFTNYQDIDLAPATFMSYPFYGNTWTLLQQSQNPDFAYWPWSSDYDINAPATYEFCLHLGTDFRCPVCMIVEVSDVANDLRERGGGADCLDIGGSNDYTQQDCIDDNGFYTIDDTSGLSRPTFCCPIDYIDYDLLPIQCEIGSCDLQEYPKGCTDQVSVRDYASGGGEIEYCCSSPNLSGFTCSCFWVIQPDQDASTWDSADTLNCVTAFPVGGTGQINGGFTLYEYKDVQYGIRIQQRLVGPITPIGNYPYYDPATYVVNGGEGPDSFAWWNFDIHVDLQDSGKTIADYITDGGLKLSVSCVSGDCSSFGGPYNDLDLAPEVTGIDCGDPVVGPYYGDEWTLLQQSQNPLFSFWPWIGSYDPNAVATYQLSLKLGNLCPVTIKVKVETTVVTGTQIPQTGSAVTYDYPLGTYTFPCLPYYEFPPGTIVDNTANFNGGADCPFLSEPFVVNVDVGSTSSFSFEDGLDGPGAPFPPGAICGSTDADPADKFTLIYVGGVIGGNDLANKPLGSLESVKYSFYVKGCQNSLTSCPDQFYLNIYARLPTSGNFYDCNFAFVPSSGGDIDTWTTFDLPNIKNTPATTIAAAGASQISTITGSDCQGATTINEYLALNTDAVFGALVDGTTHWTYQLNIGDTTLQTGLEGCFDGFEMKFTDENDPRIYDFEPDALYSRRRAII